ncbi:Predicted transcriptional regulator [Halogranum rubrum]|uniref:Predicted transcriptional regulator n=1 Tax=Halogranum rubrum TaxID=553466 RepID=A0A1I4BDB0_9EURY|nr:helix-turn-helix domain-containing protein [Halogranum rubrum]SFK66270.1 Predicted transcriptional regulator [Halogranum rubrum]
MTSMVEQLQRDMGCESLLECFHGLSQLDEDCFEVLTEAPGPLTIDEVAAAVDRERSTIYRSVQRLRTAGFVQKTQINHDNGGYYHVYSPTEPSKISGELQRMLNDWYAKMGPLIAEFEKKYEQSETSVTQSES